MLAQLWNQLWPLLIAPVVIDDESGLHPTASLKSDCRFGTRRSRTCQPVAARVKTSSLWLAGLAGLAAQAISGAGGPL